MGNHRSILMGHPNFTVKIFTFHYFNFNSTYTDYYSDSRQACVHQDRRNAPKLSSINRTQKGQSGPANWKTIEK